MPTSGQHSCMQVAYKCQAAMVVVVSCIINKKIGLAPHSILLLHSTYFTTDFRPPGVFLITTLTYMSDLIDTIHVNRHAMCSDQPAKGPVFKAFTPKPGRR